MEIEYLVKRCEIFAIFARNDSNKCYFRLPMSLQRTRLIPMPCDIS
jgi:hypothetical protein